VVWSLARVLSTSIRLGHLDGIARFLLAAWQINAVLSGTTGIVLCFTAVELMFGIIISCP